MSVRYAELDWQIIDGIEIPISKQYGDVYFSKDNGLNETRHVFLDGNDLSTRLKQLTPFAYFCVGETGFGTGLNFLALWQLWRQLRPSPSCRLHVVSVEKFPLHKNDLARALAAWPELNELSQQLLQQYPSAVAGCHRLNFAQDGLSLDLWLGDAVDVLPHLVKTHAVDAWFLDGFAPACNPEIWQSQVLDHVIRLSGAGTTFASFSVAGVLKRGLQAHGVQISRPRGYRHKREMLKAVLAQPTTVEAISVQQDVEPNSHLQDAASASKTARNRQRFAVIGAGIAGLNCAWALAQRGHQVRLIDGKAPLSGASGNPMALLNPKLSAAAKSADHLMTLAWQQALRFYADFDGYRALQVDKLVFKANDHSLELAQDYPDDVLMAQAAQQSFLPTDVPCVQLKQAGCIVPQRFAAQVLAHPNIAYVNAQITHLAELDDAVQLWGASSEDAAEQLVNTVDRVIVCCAGQSHQLLPDYPTLRPIRGQVSWCEIEHGLPLQNAYSYGGYALAQDATQLLLGASFHPGRDDDAVLLQDHHHNLTLLQQFFPSFAAQLPAITTWHGRAAIRAQTRDYLPIVGAHGNSQRIFSLAGMGSKGFLFAPLCSEVLCALMLQEACPISDTLLQQLSPQRFIKKIKAPKVKKPYIQADAIPKA